MRQVRPSALLLFALLVPGVARAQVDARQELIDTREEWGRAIAAGEIDRIFSFWTDDVVIYPVSEPPVRGIAAVREYVRRNREERGVSPRSTPLEFVVSRSGDLGYVLGTYVWIDRAGRAVDPGRYVSLWRRDEEGGWRCFLEIHSPGPATAAEGTSAP